MSYGYSTYPFPYPFPYPICNVRYLNIALFLGTYYTQSLLYKQNLASLQLATRNLSIRSDRIATFGKMGCAPGFHPPFHRVSKTIGLACWAGTIARVWNLAREILLAPLAAYRKPSSWLKFLVWATTTPNSAPKARDVTLRPPLAQPIYSPVIHKTSKGDEF